VIAGYAAALGHVLCPEEHGHGVVDFAGELAGGDGGELEHRGNPLLDGVVQARPMSDRHVSHAQGFEHQKSLEGRVALRRVGDLGKLSDPARVVADEILVG
jgi:hypothetical protein